MALKFSYYLIRAEIPHLNCLCVIGTDFNREPVIVTQRKLVWKWLLFVFLAPKVLYLFAFLSVKNHVPINGQN